MAFTHDYYLALRIGEEAIKKTFLEHQLSIVKEKCEQYFSIIYEQHKKGNIPDEDFDKLLDDPTFAMYVNNMK